jgi:hypothetical protein
MLDPSSGRSIVSLGVNRKTREADAPGEGRSPSGQAGSDRLIEFQSLTPVTLDAKLVYRTMTQG